MFVFFFLSHFCEKEDNMSALLKYYAYNASPFMNTDNRLGEIGSPCFTRPFFMS